MQYTEMRYHNDIPLYKIRHKTILWTSIVWFQPRIRISLNARIVFCSIRSREVLYVFMHRYNAQHDIKVVVPSVMICLLTCMHFAWAVKEDNQQNWGRMLEGLLTDESSPCALCPSNTYIFSLPVCRLIRNGNGTHLLPSWCPTLTVQLKSRST